jgi:hypothetical protein
MGAATLDGAATTDDGAVTAGAVSAGAVSAGAGGTTGAATLDGAATTDDGAVTADDGTAKARRGFFVFSSTRANSPLRRSMRSRFTTHLVWRYPYYS